MNKKTDVRCVICSRILTNPLSIARGIGPVCIEKISTEEGKIEVQRITRELNLPCTQYQECRYCPYNIHRTCPRERMVLQKDIRGGKTKICAFCGEQITGGYHTYKSGNKRVFECSECYTKNERLRK